VLAILLEIHNSYNCVTYHTAEHDIKVLGQMSAQVKFVLTLVGH